MLDAKTYVKAAGWRLPRDVLEKIQWSGTLLCIGKKRNEEIIDAIKENKPCIIACPWSSETSYSLEILDRIVTFPKIISSTILTRMDGLRKVSVNEPWIIASLDTVHARRLHQSIARARKSKNKP